MVAGAGLARKNNQFSFIVIVQTFESDKNTGLGRVFDGLKKYLYQPLET